MIMTYIKDRSISNNRYRKEAMRLTSIFAAVTLASCLPALAEGPKSSDDKIAPVLHIVGATLCSIQQPSKCDQIYFDDKGRTNSVEILGKGGVREGSTFTHDTCVPKAIDNEEASNRLVGSH